MTIEEIINAHKKIPKWTLSKDKKSIVRSFETKGFNSAVELINRIAVIAGNLNHHPDLHLLDYRNLTVELTTHSAAGLSEKDFIAAAEIQETAKDLINQVKS